MKYLSSRGKYTCDSAAQAIKLGLSPDGGLFVPEKIPAMTDAQMQMMADKTYIERAALILGEYLSDFSALEIEECVKKAYGEGKFDHSEVAPLHKLDENVYVLELWHGPTCAFKDMALQLLPHLLTASMAKTGEQKQILILVATSGDTGKAALEGFRDVPGTRIVVFFPEEGVSQVQKLQMLTQEGSNVLVAAVKGNFDDAQNGVKAIFSDFKMAEELRAKGFELSSANSINWGRLAPQIIYYISAYLDAARQGVINYGQPVNVVVPTGNFGNILAAFYARSMGVNIKRLICASNANNVLTDFINTGTYDRSRQFHKTISPSMDILISSNLERLLFEMTGRDAGRVAVWMEELKNLGRYTVEDDVLAQIREIFWADYASDQETRQTIAQTWEKYKYLIDTHTAVGLNVYQKYREATGDESPVILASTASPYKFGGSVSQALIGEKAARWSEFEALQALEKLTGVPIPNAIKGLENKTVRFNLSTRQDRMGEVLLSTL
ncbi:MAG: threonine synthase [Syntrophomonas sp.]